MDAEYLVEVIRAFPTQMLDVSFEEAAFIVWIEGWVVESWVVV